jgi:hypothetical protein
MPQTKTGDHTLSEPAPSKFISTLHKKHIMREFAGKMPRISWSWSTQTGDRTLCEPAPLDISQEPCYAENYR